MWITPLVLVVALLAFAVAHWALRKKYPQDPTTLIDLIEEVLPQTQCAQCGYPGCRPYAAAIVTGEALNLCPPGGQRVYLDLVELMGEAQSAAPPAQPTEVVAVIDESQCIGCALCLAPCPVDAIVGSMNKMHTVIESLCTGCELCVPACPVDCITLQPLPISVTATLHRELRLATHNCINCGFCNPACPVGLPAQELFHALQQDNSALANSQGLMQCIECGLCDRACPSNIGMAGLFAAGKRAQRERASANATRRNYKERFAVHQARHQQRQSSAAEKRAKRLAASRQFS